MLLAVFCTLKGLIFAVFAVFAVYREIFIVCSTAKLSPREIFENRRTAKLNPRENFDFFFSLRWHYPNTDRMAMDTFFLDKLLLKLLPRTYYLEIKVVVFNFAKKIA